MTQDEFESNLVTGFTWPIIRRNVAVNNTTVKIMQIAPIPAFLILDGFTQDLCAAELLERIMGLADTTGEMFTHLKNFLLAVLTGHNLGDHSPRIAQPLLMAQVPADARRWAGDKFKKAFPALQPAPTTPAPGGIHPDIIALLAQLIPTQQNAPATAAATAATAENKEDDTILNMSKQEYDGLLQMCGLPPNSPPEALPGWMTDCSAKGMTDHYRGTILGKFIRDNVHFEDAEVPLTNNVIKMAIKRNWTGKEGNINRPALVNATEGLTPFALLDLDEDEVAKLNDEEEALAAASHTTKDQYMAMKKKHIATVPEEPEAFLRLLKCYANWLYALFSNEGPLYKCVRQIIKDILAYSHAARARLSMSTKASILWVIHKQSRKFAIAELDIIGEFDEMQRVLSAKNASFNHAETPAELWQKKKDDKKRKDPIGDPTRDPKKPRPTPQFQYGNNRNAWHQTLRDKLGTPLKTANYPTFTAIMNYCGKNADEVFGPRSKKCGPNAFFGRCKYGLNCTKDHSMPSEAEVAQILTLTKKFQEKPEGLAQG